MRYAIQTVAVILFYPLAGALHAQNQVANWESAQVHPIELTADGTRLCVVNTIDQRLEVFDVAVAGGTPQWLRSIAVGSEPVSVRARSNNEVWVVNHLSDTISIVDLPSGRVTATLATGDEPTDVVFAGAAQRAFVSVSQLNQLRVFDPANLAAAPSIIALQGEEPRALAVSPDGARVYAGFFESGNLTTAVRQQDVSNAAGPYAGQNPPPNSGTTFDPPISAGLTTPPPVAQIVRRDGAGAWRDVNGRDFSAFVTWNLHDHDVAIINANALSVTYANSLMTTVMALAVRADGTVTAVGTEARNEIRFEPKVKSIFIRVRIGAFDPSAPNPAQIADLNPQLDYSTASVAQSVRDQAIGDPRAIVWHPSTGNAYVAGMGSNNVIVTNVAGARLGRIEVGQGPTGLALSANGARLYVLNRFDASISLIDTATATETSRTAFFDPTPQTIKLGRPLLYDTHATSGLGQASCASCHVDGRSDFLAWDLGNPAGAMKAFNQSCRIGICRDWNPMKGLMVTQSLQGIIGNEPLHWRGDKENLAAFAAAFTGLQGMDAEPGATQLQQFSDFIASIRYQPNPNRNEDGTLPATQAVTGGTGDPASGLNLFQTLPVLAGGATCQTCHALPIGTSGQIDDPMLALAPQPMKNAQLRALWEKVGWVRTSQNNSKGFGFNHHSEFDTLQSLLLAGFNFGAPANAPRNRRDVEAFLLNLDTETHAAVGKQVMFDGSNSSNASDLARLNAFIALADVGAVSVISKGAQNGLGRSWLYATQGIWLSDRENHPTTLAELLAGAAVGSEITFTVVPALVQFRAGVDRDADGWFDRDESDHGADPNNTASTPNGFCKADFNGDAVLNTLDLDAFTAAFNAGSPRANYDHSLGANNLPTVTSTDLSAYQAAFALGCANAQFADGFE